VPLVFLQVEVGCEVNVEPTRNLSEDDAKFLQSYLLADTCCSFREVDKVVSTDNSSLNDVSSLP